MPQASYCALYLICLLPFDILKAFLFSLLHTWKKMIVGLSEDWWGAKKARAATSLRNLLAAVNGWVSRLGLALLYFVWPFQNDSEDFGAICALRVPLIPLLLHSAVMGTLNLCNMPLISVTHTHPHTQEHTPSFVAVSTGIQLIYLPLHFWLLLALVSLFASVIYS